MVKAKISKTFSDDSIYDSIKKFLQNQIPDDDEKVDCMVDYYRSNNVADKFYSIDLLLNQEKLRQELQPYADDADSNCNKVVRFIKSPLGLSAIVITSLILLIIIVSIFVHCIKRKRHSVSFDMRGS